MSTSGVDRDGSVVQWRGLALVLLAICAVVIVFTFDDYGVTYDEQWQATYGEYVIRWYTSGFTDHSALTYRNLMHYGGFADVILNLGTRVLPFGYFETRHLLTGVFALLGLTATWRVASFIAGPRAGFFALVLLMLAPRYWGDAFSNMKDIPFAALGILVLDRTIRWIPLLPNVPARHVLLLGLSLGLLLGVRVGGVLFAGYVGLACAGWGALALGGRLSLGDLGRAVRAVAGRLTMVGVVAYCVMVAWWPAAQADPLQPLRSIKWATRFPTPFNVYYEGADVSIFNLPWYYLPKWFLMVMPEALLLAVGVAVSLALFRVRGALATRDPKTLHRVLATATVAAAVIVPFAYVILRRPVTYDGIRHFLFILPPLAVVGALGLDGLLRGPRVRLAALVILPAAGISLALTAVDMVRLHPYQYIYFNRAVAGGMQVASQSFETDYWGASYKEGVEWLVNNVPKRPDGGLPRVASCLYATSTSYYLPSDRFEYVGSLHDGQQLTAEPEILLATTRWNCHKSRPGKVVHVVQRAGVPLLYIIETSR